MAKYNLDNYTAADGLGFPLNFRRGNPNPLDNSSVWSSYDAMISYAQTDATAYVGQVLSVVDHENNKVTVYSIQDEAGNVKAVGTSPIGDESTIIVDEDGTVSLYGIEGLTLTREDEQGNTIDINYQPLLVKGKLTWVEPSATTVEGLATEIEGLKTRLSTAESDIAKMAASIGTVEEGKTVVEMISAAQTAATDDANDAIDAAKIALIGTVDDESSADTIKASKKYTDEKISALLDGATDETLNSIKELADAIKENDSAIEALNDIAGSKAAQSDLESLVNRVVKVEEDYLKAADKTELQGNIDTLSGTVGGISTDLDSAKEKIAALENVGAEKNVIASVDSEQFAIDEARQLTLLDISMDKVTGLADALSGKVDTQVDDEGNAYTLLSPADKAKLDGIEEAADANVIEAITLNGVALEVTDKTINIALAGEGLGVVKSSDADNKISVNTEGEMEINNVNVNKLVQSTGETLILNGGSATV